MVFLWGCGKNGLAAMEYAGPVRAGFNFLKNRAGAPETESGSGPVAYLDKPRRACAPILPTQSQDC